MTKANFGDTAPLIIYARLMSAGAPLVEFHLVGQGKYPYDCQHKKDYPNAYIYVNARGGWTGSFELELQADGSYIIRSKND